MMKPLYEFLAHEVKHLDHAGLLRRDPQLTSAPGPTVKIDGWELLNLASSDYLGLSTHAEVTKAAVAAIEKWGVGAMAPRMAGGSSPVHSELELTLATFLGTEEALLYPTGYHASAGVFESLLSDRDYVFCDEQVQPGVADGVRLSRARVYSYRNRDLVHLEDRLKRSRAARFRVIVTDGVFPLSGLTADLVEIYRLATRYGAIVAVDDSHGIGVLGESGRGTHDHLGLNERIDLVTGTFDCALGGGAGGFVAGRREVVSWLRQKSRPHLASMAVAPSVCAAVLRSFDLLRSEPHTRAQVLANVKLFRDALANNGLWTTEGEHPAVAVLIRDAVAAQRLADLLYKKGVFAIGFCYPIVPDGAARIRAQVTAHHSPADLERAAALFAESATELHLALEKKSRT
jgi:glycine C-acetyltransferase